LALLV
jgi:hypothetical protein